MYKSYSGVGGKHLVRKKRVILNAGGVFPAKQQGMVKKGSQLFQQAGFAGERTSGKGHRDGRHVQEGLGRENG